MNKYVINVRITLESKSEREPDSFRQGMGIELEHLWNATPTIDSEVTKIEITHIDEE